MNEVELAYLAGLFDGEGCIYILHNKPHRTKKTEQHTLKCVVSMADKCSVESFHAFGGSLYCDRRSKKNPNWADQWVWIIESNQALAWLELILPYLRLKKPEARLAIEFQSKRRGHRVLVTETVLQERDWYYRTLSALKKTNGRIK